MRYTDLPFPRYRHQPGVTPHPERDPAGHSFGLEPSKVEPLTPDNCRRHTTYLFGIDLFNEGYYWEAHVEWERLWAIADRGRDTGRRSRTMLQGLVQLAAAMVKAREGNDAGTRKLAARASRKIAEVGAVQPQWMGLPLGALKREIDERVAAADLGAWHNCTLALTDSTHST